LRKESGLYHLQDAGDWDGRWRISDVWDMEQLASELYKKWILLFEIPRCFDQDRIARRVRGGLTRTVEKSFRTAICT
jgi:hypothetical protein